MTELAVLAHNVTNDLTTIAARAATLRSHAERLGAAERDDYLREMETTALRVAETVRTWIVGPCEGP